MVNINTISIPLQQKQIFSFSDMNEINVFFKKILAVFDMEYSEEVYKNIVLKYFEEMRSKYNSPQQTTKDIASDNYVIELGKKIDNLLNYVYSNGEKKIFSYEVPIEYEIEKRRKTEFIRIDSELTVSDILDEIYFLLYGKVLPYTYLSSWILREKKTKRYALISSVQDWIPASYIFKPETTWEVIYILDDDFMNKILKEEREGTCCW